MAGGGEMVLPRRLSETFLELNDRLRGDNRGSSGGSLRQAGSRGARGHRTSLRDVNLTQNISVEGSGLDRNELVVAVERGSLHGGKKLLDAVLREVNRLDDNVTGRR
jgi:hypothetical protein